MVIGTVKGDIHDIGKNLVAMMMEGAGFEVFDLGVNTSVDEYLAALDEHQPDILGLSALLTTTMPYMKIVIDTLMAKGRRDDYIVLVGGAPLNEEFGAAVGADAYCRDASIAAETAKTLVVAPVEPVAERTAPRPLVVACGALARELRTVLAQTARRQRRPLRSDYLPANLHNRPERDSGGGRAGRASRPGRTIAIFVAYADCGTGGLLDPLLDAARRAPDSRARTATSSLPAPSAFARAGRSRARHLLPHRLPGPTLRRAGVSRASVSTATPNSATSTSANYTPGGVALAVGRPGARWHASGGRPHRLGLAFEHHRRTRASQPRSHRAASRRRRAPPDRGRGPELVTICWRDIPAQVNAQDGRTRYQASLPRRFQRAVDDAAMAAGLTQAADYVAEWRRRSDPSPEATTPDELQAAADAAAARFDAAYSARAARGHRRATADSTRSRRDARVAVVFTPSGLSGTVDAGTTVLDAARQLGVDLDSVCGGRGICGHCQVMPTTGSFANGRSTDAGRDLTRRRPRNGDPTTGAPVGSPARGSVALRRDRRGDAVIDVPAASQVHRPVVRKAVALDDLVVDPLVTLAYVELPPAADGRHQPRRRSSRCAREQHGRTFDSVEPHVLAALHAAFAGDPRTGTIALGRSTCGDAVPRSSRRSRASPTPRSASRSTSAPPPSPVTCATSRPARCCVPPGA